MPAIEKLIQYPEAYEACQFALAENVPEVPSTDELSDLWKTRYHNSDSVYPVPNIYGLMTKPEYEDPWLLLSVDLCEVTRKTAESVAKLGGFTLEHMGAEYFYGTPFGLPKEDNDLVVLMTQAQMVRESVGPVEGIDEIASILKEIKSLGGYVLANTSTLPGCEQATVDWMSRFLPDCFDGIVIPRNHFGEGSITKGDAVLSVVNNLKDRFRVAISHVIHIDDASHHILSVRERCEHNLIVDDFTPRYSWNSGHEALNIKPSPLECFRASRDLVINYGKD